jgi:ribosomal protein L24E
MQLEKNVNCVLKTQKPRSYTMTKTLCSWCFKVIEKEESGIIELPKQSGLFFCSEKCLDHVTFKYRDRKNIDYDKLQKHAKQVIRRQNSNAKSQRLASLLGKEKLDKEDLALLCNLLTPKQKFVLSLIGLSNLSWSVHNEPKKLMAKIDALVKSLRG